MELVWCNTCFKVGFYKTDSKSGGNQSYFIGSHIVNDKSNNQKYLADYNNKVKKVQEKMSKVAKFVYQT